MKHSLKWRGFKGRFGYPYLVPRILSVLLAFFPASLTADDVSSAFTEAYVGVWCGDDKEHSWRLIIDENGTYSQFNQPFQGVVSTMDAHFEFGTWSIEGVNLLKKMQGIQYANEGIRPIEPAWKFEFEILVLNSEELIVEYKEFGLISQSTRECVDS